MSTPRQCATGGLHLIWAQDRDGVIGCDGALPWHLPEDLAHFRDRTRGHTVIMGRATFDSLPASVRPLPGRRNLVLTRSQECGHPGAHQVSSLAQAHDLAAGGAWVIGGASVYAQALPRACCVVRTDIDTAVRGTAWAPALPPDWQADAPDSPWLTSVSGLRYRITTWRPPRP